jgi:hypothetical protein
MCCVMVSIVGTYAETGSDTGDADNTAVIVFEYFLKKKNQTKQRIECRDIQYNGRFWIRRRRGKRIKRRKEK